MNFMKSHCCYDAIPVSCKLVIFDTQLQVRGVHESNFYVPVYFSSLISPQTVWLSCFQRWKKPSLHWWQMAWGLRFYGTASYRHLWVRKCLCTITFPLHHYICLNAGHPFLTGMLTITDFINILHCYYKSPLVSMHMQQFKISMHH